MVSIQVHVDEVLRESAERRAAELGVGLSAYVRDLIRRDLARPTVNSWLDDVLADPIGEPLDAAETVADARSTHRSGG